SRQAYEVVELAGGEFKLRKAIFEDGAAGPVAGSLEGEVKCGSAPNSGIEGSPAVGDEEGGEAEVGATEVVELLDERVDAASVFVVHVVTLPTGREGIGLVEENDDGFSAPCRRERSRFFEGGPDEV